MTRADADAAWQAIGGCPSVLEAFVHFEREFSILLARGIDGRIVTWDAPDNEHNDGILARSTVPAGPLIRSQVAERSEEHTSELQSLMRTSYAVFCLKKKK